MTRMIKHCIVFILFVGLGIGLMATQKILFEVPPKDRAEAMVWLFKKYCAPLHSGRRTNVNKAMVPIAHLLYEQIYVEPRSQLHLRRSKHTCSVSDEKVLLSDFERRQLANLFENFVHANHPEFERDYDHGLDSWGHFSLWAVGEKNHPDRAAIIHMRFRDTGYASETFTALTIATPKAPEVKPDNMMLPRL